MGDRDFPSSLKEEARSSMASISSRVGGSNPLRAVVPLTLEVGLVCLVLSVLLRSSDSRLT